MKALILAGGLGIRFSEVDIVNDGTVFSFMEKSGGNDAWINAGYFFLKTCLKCF